MSRPRRRDGYIVGVLGVPPPKKANSVVLQPGQAIQATLPSANRAFDLLFCPKGGKISYCSLFDYSRWMIARRVPSNGWGWATLYAHAGRIVIRHNLPYRWSGGGLIIHLGTDVRQALPECSIRGRQGLVEQGDCIRIENYSV